SLNPLPSTTTTPLSLHDALPISVQQFRNTTGKNATDSALIIDAMDLLHTRELGGFCLVSSDSDFTRLATRIREDGFPVYGFGERSEEHTSELQSLTNLVCRLLLE